MMVRFSQQGFFFPSKSFESVTPTISFLCSHPLLTGVIYTAPFVLFLTSQGQNLDCL